MSVATSHQISRYYDFYRDKEVVLTKSNLKFLRMDPRQFFVKCNGGQWPCIINSTSLQMAKVLVGTSSGLYAEVQKSATAALSLRYCFVGQSGEPVSFFVNCNVVDIKPYQGSTDLVIITLYFTQRPPDDLIMKIGEFIEINENSKTRKEERIPINKNSLLVLGIPKEESVVFIADVPRRCILKDLSFGGARVMLVGIPKFLMGKKIDLMLLFTETNEKLKVPGTIINSDFLEGRKDIAVVHISFDEEEIPMAYKSHVNKYMTSYQKQMIENQLLNQAKEEKAQAEAAARSEKRSAQIAASFQKEKEAEEREEYEKAEKAANQFYKEALGLNVQNGGANPNQNPNAAPNANNNNI